MRHPNEQGLTLMIRESLEQFCISLQHAMYFGLFCFVFLKKKELSYRRFQFQNYRSVAGDSMHMPTIP